MAAHSKAVPTLIVLALLATACGSTASPAQSGQALPSAGPVAGGAESPAAIPASSDPIVPAGSEELPVPTTAPTEPSSEPSAPVTPAGWSKPIVVPGLDDSCTSDIVAAVDSRGGYHVATTCYVAGNWTEIRYSTSPDGRTWTTRAFRPPARHWDMTPQLVVDGDTVHLAFTRQVLTDGACGDDGMADVGVFDRTRSLPSGEWSAPKRIGPRADHLQAFRVRKGVIHATVASNEETRTWYERIRSGVIERVRIADTLGPVALRVGDDGVARLAYEGSKGIRFATVKGGRLIAATIPGSAGGFAPVLSLGPGDVAYVMWKHTAHGGGCADGGPDPDDGTYFATNAGGTWSSARLSKSVGSASLALDPATGDVLALVTGEERGSVSMTAYRQVSSGAWTSERISDRLVEDGVLRVNPVTGTQIVVYGAYSKDGMESTVRVRLRT